MRTWDETPNHSLTITLGCLLRDHRRRVTDVYVLLFVASFPQCSIKKQVGNMTCHWQRGRGMGRVCVEDAWGGGDLLPRPSHSLPTLRHTRLPPRLLATINLRLHHHILASLKSHPQKGSIESSTEDLSVKWEAPPYAAGSISSPAGCRTQAGLGQGSIVHPCPPPTESHSSLSLTEHQRTLAAIHHTRL